MKRHINIPIFIPHLGCPNDCAFCNQRSISGRNAFEISSVKKEIESALLTVAGADAEIAFFGGSFTGIDRALMTELLDIAEDYVRMGQVSSVRLSTRPDYISEEILDILKRYSVKHIELGIQSIDDGVLSACKRGHTASDTVRACELIKRYGFTLVGQMMIGLPGATGESEIATAKAICELGAAEARIYPIVILKETHLATMTERGEYIPLSEDELIKRSADVLEVFRAYGVKVLRIGLHAGDELTSREEIAQGFYHPAMGELVEGEVFYRKIRQKLHGVVNTSDVIVRVPKGCLSKAIGQRGRNRDRLIKELSMKRIIFTEDDEIDEVFVEVR